MGEERRGERTSGLPDNLDEFTHVDVVWHQELGLVQDGKLFFSFIPLNDHLQNTHTHTQLISDFYLLFWWNSTKTEFPFLDLIP